jgi:hypothetical protein
MDAEAAASMLSEVMRATFLMVRQPYSSEQANG